ncbi:YceI family protein [Aromatoleum evansii]|uniref:YceI family protein n=1 Tax=Aromatoleum evansii TaxID=59406 RepID=A0ABZ1AGR0_AROEV|nr:YceI family protein [Aromatoleum evansii]NMG27722.1 polyisoprenoid-binding protein [Aromatoleum evansii]WRL44484.1 YceI family protein [Aromatoleum evansii]
MRIALRPLLLALALGTALALPAHAQQQSASGAVATKTTTRTAAAKPATGDLAAGDYVIDVAHSHVYFFISHLGVSRFMGRFDDIKGTFVIGQKPAESAVSATVPVASVNTKHQKLEDHLKSPDFFDVAQFPTMSFESTRVNWNNRGEGVLSGNLTIHGVTKPVDFNLKLTGAGKGPRGDTRAGFEGTTTIKRSDFGMTYGLPRVVGDTVEIALSIEGIRQ